MHTHVIYHAIGLHLVNSPSKEPNFCQINKYLSCCCIYYDPLFGWDCSYVCHKLKTENKDIFAKLPISLVACNWHSPCKLIFKEAIFYQNYWFFELLLRLFRPYILMTLCASKPRIKNWEQRYLFSIVKKSSKQFPCKRSLC